MVNVERVLTQFQTVFGGPAPRYLAQAPGRVNLIGEHTDYNEGFVLPMAIDRGVRVAMRPTDNRRLIVHSAAFGRTAEVALERDPPQASEAWANYVLGVAALLAERGVRVGGAEMLIDSDLPPGGGLSSSAALEAATAKALLAAGGGFMAATELALLCRQAEAEYAGSPCGIMDQYAALLAKDRHALFLDCRTLAFDHIPFRLEDVRLAVVDTGVRHEVAGPGYERRRLLCEQAVGFLQSRDEPVQALRDATEEMLAAYGGDMPPEVADCCRHVVAENHRVLRAAEDLRAGAVHEFGQLMYESHGSLRDGYRVSCPELDAVVEIAADTKGVYGARLTGAGFGGCAIVLLEERAAGSLEERIRSLYNSRFARPAEVFFSSAAEGASCLEL